LNPIFQNNCLNYFGLSIINTTKWVGVNTKTQKIESMPHQNKIEFMEYLVDQLHFELVSPKNTIPAQKLEEHR